MHHNVPIGRRRLANVRIRENKLNVVVGSEPVIQELLSPEMQLCVRQGAILGAWTVFSLVLIISRLGVR